MSPTQAWQLTAALGVVFFGLFLLRARARRVVVPSLAPWRGRVRKRARPIWRELLALVLQVAAAGLVVQSMVEAAPADTGTQELPGDAPSIAVLDLSGSMRATDRMPAAREAVVNLHSGLIAAGEQARLLAEPDASKGELKAALARAVPGTGPGRLEEAIELARSLGYRPYVLGDDERADRVVGVGQDDVSIDDVAATTSPGLPPQLALAVRLTNHGGAARTIRLRLEDESGPFAEETVRLRAGQTDEPSWFSPPRDSGWLRARLVDHEDGLALNDEGYALLPRVDPAEVWVVGPANRYLDDALAVMPGVKLRRLTASQLRRPPAQVDLVILDRVSPELQTEVPVVWIAPPRGPANAPQPMAQATDPVFSTWNHSHALFRGVALRFLELSEASLLRLPEGYEALAATVDGAVIAVKDEAPKRAVLGFDVTRTDLPLTVAWPQLVYNLLLWARTTGEELQVAAAQSAGRGLALDPSGPVAIERVDRAGSWEQPQGTARLSGLDPGIYRVSERGGSRLVALNWDPGEPGSARSGTPVSASEPLPQPPPPPPVPPWLLLGAIALLFIEFPVAPR